MRQVVFDGYVVDVIRQLWMESYVAVYLKCDKCGYIQGHPSCDDPLYHAYDKSTVALSSFNNPWYQGMSGNAPKVSDSFRCKKCGNVQEYNINPSEWRF